jgi:hypothetical protein
MIVPNSGRGEDPGLMATERDGGRIDFLPAIESRGYKLMVRRPKYADAGVQKHGIFPTYYYLFELVS